LDVFNDNILFFSFFGHYNSQNNDFPLGLSYLTLNFKKEGVINV